MSMTIRPATLEDIPVLQAMGVRFIQETTYRDHIGVSPEAITSLLQRLIEHETAVVFVTDRDGEITGMIGLVRFDHPVSGESIVSEMFWWMEPERRGDGIRLLRHAERWAKSDGAVRFQMIAPTPQVARVYRALGYTEIETTFQRSLT